MTEPYQRPPTTAADRKVGCLVILGVIAGFVLFGWWQVREEMGDDYTHPTPASATLPGVTPPVAAVQEPKLPLRLFADYTAKCDDPVKDELKGRPRVMCTMQLATPTLLEIVGNPSDLDKITIGVSMPKDLREMLGAMTEGFNFIARISGHKVGQIAPEDWMEKLAVEKQSFTYDGIEYSTNPVPAMGILFFSAARL